MAAITSTGLRTSGIRPNALRKYNGIPKHNFPLCLEEREFRFNYGTHKQQLKILKEWAGI
jgi:transposase-like protein